MSHNDRHHQRADRIYRAVRETGIGSGNRVVRRETSGPLAAALERDFSEVEKAVSMWYAEHVLLRSGEKGFVQRFCLVEGPVLDSSSHSWPYPWR